MRQMGWLVRRGWGWGAVGGGVNLFMCDSDKLDKTWVLCADHSLIEFLHLQLPPSNETKKYDIP
jgi:hypothetical protein